MPYKPTGNPPGRPRTKNPRPAPVVVQPAYYVPPIKRTRLRNRFREHAERLAPSTAIQIYDSRGRPRHRPTSQNRIA